MGKSMSIWYLAAAVFLTVLWAVAAELVALPIIPSPVLVVENLADIFMKHIAIHSLYSLWRIAAGLLLAVAVGLLHCFPVRREILEQPASDIRMWRCM